MRVFIEGGLYPSDARCGLLYIPGCCGGLGEVECGIVEGEGELESQEQGETFRG